MSSNRAPNAVPLIVLIVALGTMLAVLPAVASGPVPVAFYAVALVTIAVLIFVVSRNLRKARGHR